MCISLDDTCIETHIRRSLWLGLCYGNAKHKPGMSTSTVAQSTTQCTDSSLMASQINVVPVSPLLYSLLSYRPVHVVFVQIRSKIATIVVQSWEFTPLRNVTNKHIPQQTYLEQSRSNTGKTQCGVSAWVQPCQPVQKISMAAGRSVDFLHRNGCFCCKASWPDWASTPCGGCWRQSRSTDIGYAFTCWAR